MKQIDDSSSGSLIGGVCIGLLDTNSLGYYFEIIPLKLYKQESFHKKVYLDYTVDIVKRGIKFLYSTNAANIIYLHTKC